MALGIMAIAVGGCAAVPFPVQLVSWVVDGFSYVVSQKSVADHGLSAAMQKDCALWRGLTDGRICHADDATTMIAKAENTPDRTAAGNSNDPTDITEGLREAGEPASLETAAGASDEPWIPGPYLTIALAPDEPWIPRPYLTIEPNSAPTHEELSALSERSLIGRF